MSTAETRLSDLAPVEEPGHAPPTPAPRRPRRGIVAVVSALVLVVAYGLYQHYAGTAPAGAAQYLTATVDRGSIEQAVSATGTVNPVKIVQVGTYVSGPIIALDVDFNSPVTKGQRVAKIDPASFTVKVRQAEAAVVNARARVDKDRADLALKRLLLERNRTLLGQKLVAQNDVDTAKSNYDQAVAQLALDEAVTAQEQANLEEAQVNLRYTDILSPVDGVVVSRNVDVGQTVAASFQTPTLFLIAEDLTKMQVDTNVSESDVGRVEVGQPATFTVDAYPGKRFRGTVAQVRNAPIVVQNVVTYDVVTAVDNPDQELKPGMTANVAIVTARRDGVLRVSTRALRFRPDETAAEKPEAGRGSVYVLDGDDLRRVEIETGIQDAQHVEVLKGELHEGDRVVTGVRREVSSTPPPQLPGFAGGGRRFR